MKILLNVAVLIVILNLSRSEESTTTLQPNVTTSTENLTTTTSAAADTTTIKLDVEYKTFIIIRENQKDSREQLSPEEHVKIKSLGLRDLVNHTLYNDENYRTNPKKIECIVDYFKKNDFSDDIHSEIVNVHNSTVSIKYDVTDKNMLKLKPIIDDAGSGCFMSGFISLVILTILMFFIVGSVMWLHKKQARWSRFDSA